ncbi:hypothetical protein AAF712_003201 [Marasmius tenuissimus]|uniref:Uncharacterized protein n=1 Tax=Marasmius tenuissimus TaxID=585030 RepID=A0ABR3A972_9AGAR
MPFLNCWASPILSNIISMTKKKANPQKRGAKEWPKGHKLVMLESYEGLFHKNHADMFTAAAKKFCATWGYDLNEVEREKEATRRAKFYTKVRKQIAGWASHRWLKKKTDKEGVEQVIKKMAALTAVRPRRAQARQFYQKNHYNTRVKPSFKPYWKEARKSLGASDRLAEMNSFTDKKWAEEDDAFKEQVRAEIEAEYQEKLGRYKERISWEGNTKGYSESWKNAGRILPTIADSIGGLFGAGAAIILYGPGSDGEISVLSVSSYIPESQMTMGVRDFDEDGMNKTHAIFQKYAEACFSQEVCASRIVPETSQESEGEPDEDKDELVEDEGNVVSRTYQWDNSTQASNLIGSEAEIEAAHVTRAQTSSESNTAASSEPATSSSPSSRPSESASAAAAAASVPLPQASAQPLTVPPLPVLAYTTGEMGIPRSQVSRQRQRAR